MGNTNLSYIYSNSRWTFVAHASALHCKISEYLNLFQWFNKPLTWLFCFRICSRTEGPSASGSTDNARHWCRLCHGSQYYHRWQKFMQVFRWWRGQWVCVWTINKLHLPYKTGLNVMQSHPLCMYIIMHATVVKKRSMQLRKEIYVVESSKRLLVMD